MRDEIAFAIFQRLFHYAERETVARGYWDSGFWEKDKERSKRYANAALARLENPSKAMLDAARDWSIDEYGKPIGDEGARGCFVAMIRAAKKQEDRTMTHTKFAIGDRVRKIKGSSWQGRVVGIYSTALTPEGYCVESEREPGSVQIYPASALEAVV